MRAARPSLRVGRKSLPATAGRDGWPPSAVLGPPVTKSGVQVDSSVALRVKAWSAPRPGHMFRHQWSTMVVIGRRLTAGARHDGMETAWDPRIWTPSAGLDTDPSLVGTGRLVQRPPCAVVTSETRPRRIRCGYCCPCCCQAADSIARAAMRATSSTVITMAVSMRGPLTARPSTAGRSIEAWPLARSRRRGTAMALAPRHEWMTYRESGGRPLIVFSGSPRMV